MWTCFFIALAVSTYLLIGWLLIRDQFFRWVPMTIRSRKITLFHAMIAVLIAILIWPKMFVKKIYTIALEEISSDCGDW